MKIFSIFLAVIICFLGLGSGPSGAAEFSDWENGGKWLKRFGKGSEFRNSREWLQTTANEIFHSRIPDKGVKNEKEWREKIWKEAFKDETHSYASAKFSIEDSWHDYRSLVLTYSNLDFKEQFFAIRFDLKPDTLNLQAVTERYGKLNLEVVDRYGKTSYRYSIPYGESLKNAHFGPLQEVVASDNDELWVEFELQDDQTEIRSVEVLCIKASPQMIPFYVPKD